MVSQEITQSKDGGADTKLAAAEEARNRLMTRLKSLLETNKFPFEETPKLPFVIFVPLIKDERRFVLRLLVGSDAIWSQVLVLKKEDADRVPDLYKTLNEMNKDEMFGAYFYDEDSIQFRDACLQPLHASDNILMHLIYGAVYAASAGAEYLEAVLFVSKE